MARRSNYVAVKYLVNNIKKDVKNVLRGSDTLKSFDVSAPRKDSLVKVYYDTPNMFFRSHGINISLNIYSGKSKGDLVVRYDSSVSRINFLSDIPDTFIKKVNKKESMSRHFNYMATAVLELIPKGLNADAFDIIRNIVPILTINKKRERYRIINNNGIKTVFSFERNIYKSHRAVSNDKKKMQLTEKPVLSIKLDMLEVRLESPMKTKESFDKLMRQIQLDNPLFLRQQSSDLFIGQEYLDL